MSTWLKLLSLELSNIKDNDIIEPECEWEEKDHIIGTMPEMSRRLFTLGRLLEKDANQNALDSNYCLDKVKKLELEAKAYEFMAKSRVISQLMWISIRDEFELWGKPVGIRCGFRVVIYSKDDDNTPSSSKDSFGWGLI